MNIELQEKLEYIKGLAKILTESKLECLEDNGIKLSKSKHIEPKSVKVPTLSVGQMDASEDQIMSWSLSESLPSETALQKALSSEPTKQRKVRREIV